MLSSRVPELVALEAVLQLEAGILSYPRLPLLPLRCAPRHRSPGRRSPPESSSVAYRASGCAFSKGDWSALSVCFHGYATSIAFCCGNATANDVFFRPCCGETSCDRGYDHGDHANGNAYDHGIANGDGHANASGYGDESENACGDHAISNVSNAIAIVCFAMVTVSSANVWNASGSVWNGFGSVYASAIVSSVTSNAYETGISNGDPWNENAIAIVGDLSSYPWPTSQSPDR